MEGKKRDGMCYYDSNCESCLLKPDEHKEDHIGFFEMGLAVDWLLDKYPILTKEVIRNLQIGELKQISNNIGNRFNRLCHYYTLLTAEPKANYCFTVVNFINLIKPRNLLVIDEPQTIQHFYPKSVELVDIVFSESEWHAKSTLAKEFMPRLHEIKEKLIKKQRKTNDEKLILNVIERLEGFAENFDISDPKKMVEKEEEEHLLTSQIETICDVLKDADPDSLVKALSKHTYPDESDPTTLFEALLFPYKKPIIIVSSNNMRQTIYLVGDAEIPRLRIERVSAHNKVFLIGGIESEYFAKKTGEKVGKAVAVYEIAKFPYYKNFLVVPVNARSDNNTNGKKKKELSEWEKKKQRRKNLIKICTGIADVEIPVLLCTDSKQKQTHLYNEVGKYGNNAQENTRIVSRERVDILRKKVLLDPILLCYANSSIARGVDAPFIDVAALCDVEFVSPYCYAVANNQDESDERRDLAKQMQNEIISEEATNMALRITPTPDDNRPVAK